MEWIIKNKFYILLGVVGIALYFFGYMSKPDGLTKRQWEREKKELLDSAAVIYDRNMSIITEENVYLKDSIQSIVEEQELYRINKEQELYNEQKKLNKALKDLNRLTAEELERNMIKEAEKYLNQ